MKSKLEEKFEKSQGRLDGRAGYSWAIGGSLILLVSGLGYFFLPHEKPEDQIPFVLNSIIGAYMIYNFFHGKYKENQRQYKNGK